MDQNTANQPVAPQPTQPVVSPPQPAASVQSPVNAPVPAQKTGLKKWLKIVLAVTILVLLLLGGFFVYKYYFTSNKPNNATVFREPQTVKITPTPTSYQVNPNDSTNSAIDGDASLIDKNINNLNTDLTHVDQSATDQQTNLQ